MTEKIKVYEIAGENCIALEDGEKLYEIIHPKIRASEKVELDFTGVRIFASPFMNAAIGQLLRDISSEDLNKFLVINRQSMSSIGFSVLKRVIQNAKEYYSDEKMQQAVDKVISAESQEHTDSD